MRSSEWSVLTIPSGTIGVSLGMTIDTLDLSPPDRVARFREEAIEARRCARQMSLNVDRDSFLEMAARWDALADSLEKTLAGATPPSNAFDSTR